MKLMELLEQGKKATREGLEFLKYIEVFEGNLILDDRGGAYGVGFNDLTRNDWYEYKEYKTNFEFKEGEKFFIIEGGMVRNRFNNSPGYTKEVLNDFNAFPDKELAEFIQKKQLLERELMVFSYLNGASGIDWAGSTEKYYIGANRHNNGMVIAIKSSKCKNEFDKIFFTSEEICDKACELYSEDIKEVMEMKIKLGF